MLSILPLLLAPSAPTPCAVPLAVVAPNRLQEADQDAEEALARALETLEKRRYRDAWRQLEDVAEEWPESRAGNEARRRVDPDGLLGVRDVLRSGPDENRAVVVLFQDGLTLERLRVFDDLAEDVPSILAREPVFAEYLGYVNFLQAHVVSEEDGFDGHGRKVRTALGAYLVPGEAGEHIRSDPERVWAAAELATERPAAPIVFVQGAPRGTGEDGVATVGGRDANELLHQFGRAFVGLEAEFATPTGYRTEFVPGPNVSRSADPEEVPWAHWIRAKAPGIGVYPGAARQVNGVFKPKVSGCRMEDFGSVFCPVCREATLLRLHEFVDPIERVSVLAESGAGEGASWNGDQKLEFEVEVLQPATHDLRVEWYVLAAEDVPAELPDPTVRPRSARGALYEVPVEPVARTRGKKGVHRFRWKPSEHEPGRWRLVVRVFDDTKLRGEKLPWVLKDEHGLLASERGWWIERR